jgi:hypothetical protein
MKLSTRLVHYRGNNMWCLIKHVDIFMSTLIPTMGVSITCKCTYRKPLFLFTEDKYSALIGNCLHSAGWELKSVAGIRDNGFVDVVFLTTDQYFVCVSIRTILGFKNGNINNMTPSINAGFTPWRVFIRSMQVLYGIFLLLLLFITSTM